MDQKTEKLAAELEGELYWMSAEMERLRARLEALREKIRGVKPSPAALEILARYEAEIASLGRDIETARANLEGLTGGGEAL